MRRPTFGVESPATCHLCLRGVPRVVVLEQRHDDVAICVGCLRELVAYVERIGFLPTCTCDVPHRRAGVHEDDCDARPPAAGEGGQ